MMVNEQKRIIAKGAEAILSRDNGNILKERIKKGYRIREIDEKLRTERTSLEASLLSQARRVGVNTPKIVEVDKKKFRIVMEFIDGKRIKELLKESDKKTVEKICREIGRSVGKLHSANMIHGDLTTSNMILKDGKIYFIDFGLGNFSRKIEDQGVDMNLLYEALKSTHIKILELCWKNIVNGYKEEYVKAEQVLIRVREIEKRGRYMDREIHE